MDRNLSFDSLTEQTIKSLQNGNREESLEQENKKVGYAKENAYPTREYINNAMEVLEENKPVQEEILPILVEIVKRELGEEFSDINEKITELGMGQKKMKKEIEKQKEVTEKALDKVTKAEKFTDRQVRNVKRHFQQKVNELLYKYSYDAKAKIQGNLQGYIFRKYGVNAYEELLIIHQPNIVSDIKNWVPDKKLRKELEEYKRNTKQINLTLM